DVGERRGGEGRLDGHDGLSLGRGLLKRISEEGESFSNVSDVFVAQSLRVGVGSRVVVAIGKAQAVLVSLRDDLGAVFEILRRSEGKEWARLPRVQSRGDGRQFVLALDGSNFLQQRLQRLDALRVDGGGINATGVEISDLLFVGASGCGCVLRGGF